MIHESISWSDEIEVSRCLLPKVRNPVQRGLGCLGLALGFMFAAWPFLISAFFYWQMNSIDDQPQPFEWSHLLPLAFFGTFLFPLAGFLCFRGLLSLFGRSEIVITGRHLSVVRRWGLLRSRRRCRMSRLEGFRVERPGDAMPTAEFSPAGVFSFLGDSSSLVAKHSSGRSLYLARAFPSSLIDQLVETVPQRVQRIGMRAGVLNESQAGGSGMLQSLSVENSEPTGVPSFKALSQQALKGASSDAGGSGSGSWRTGENDSRLTGDSLPTKPFGSVLVLSERPDGLAIEIPKRGYRGATSPMGRLFLYAYTFMQILLSGTLLPALLAGKVQGSASAGWVIFGVFTLIWVVVMIGVLAAASWHGMITLDRRFLQFSETGIFGSNAYQWQCDAITSVTLGVESHQSDDGVTWEYYPKVEPLDSENRCWFSRLTKPEIQWLVDTLSVAMTRQRH